MLPLKDNVPTRSFPIVTVGLIVANSIVWIWEISGKPLTHDVFRYSFYPCSIDGPCVGPAAQHHLPYYEGVFTGMFMHASWGHIFFNMLFLWIFGNNVEDAMGRVRYLGFYLLSGIAAMALQTFVTIEFAGLADRSIPNLGASGAIAGVLGAYFVLLPSARVLTWVVFILLEIPAGLFLATWFVLQLWLGSFSFAQPEAGGGTAFFAHVGGFAFGVLAVRLFAVRRPLRPTY